jgi:hypothetical protein
LIDFLYFFCSSKIDKTPARSPKMLNKTLSLVKSFKNSKNPNEKSCPIEQQFRIRSTRLETLLTYGFRSLLVFFRVPSSRFLVLLIFINYRVMMHFFEVVAKFREFSKYFGLSWRVKRSGINPRSGINDYFFSQFS